MWLQLFCLSKGAGEECFLLVYFVLMGHLSPIDGIGPDQLGIDHLRSRLQSGEVTEVIMATSTTVEGETTAYYIAEMAKAFPETPPPQTEVCDERDYGVARVRFLRWNGQE